MRGVTRKIPLQENVIRGTVWVRAQVRFEIAGKKAAKDVGGPEAALRAPATSVNGARLAAR